jgi:riboflavin kinase/FMN adenylyltransferase
MRVVTVTEGTEISIAESALTIGNFDGVHRGHAEIFRHLIDRGARFGLPTIVVTFEPHPLAVLSPENAPALITTFWQKVELIEQAGVDYLGVIPFTRQFSRISAEVFVRSVLCDIFGMRHMIIGHDYAFGRDRLGNYDTLTELGATCNFSIEDLDPVGENGVVYSSSLVRRLIANGRMHEAALALGRYYSISGEVVHGREIGSILGFPTVNISTDNEVLPADGVYAVMVAVGDQILFGACNIGKNPTFNGATRTIEVFLIDFAGQLYGETIVVGFVRKIREVQKFPDVGALVRAITEDVTVTRSILTTVDCAIFKPVVGTSGRGVA